jgi:hypothetical protein
VAGAKRFTIGKSRCGVSTGNRCGGTQLRVRRARVSLPTGETIAVFERQSAIGDLNKCVYYHGLTNWEPVSSGLTTCKGVLKEQSII